MIRPHKTLLWCGLVFSGAFCLAFAQASLDSSDTNAPATVEENSTAKTTAVSPDENTETIDESNPQQDKNLSPKFETANKTKATTTNNASADSKDSAEAKKETDQEESENNSPPGPKVISGMSILGNQEAPKSLTIVPWKSSVLGDSLGITTILDDSKGPVDRDVFMRLLNYYEIRFEEVP